MHLFRYLFASPKLAEWPLTKGKWSLSVWRCIIKGVHYPTFLYRQTRKFIDWWTLGTHFVACLKKIMGTNAISYILYSTMYVFGEFSEYIVFWQFFHQEIWMIFYPIHAIDLDQLTPKISSFFSPIHVTFRHAHVCAEK